jgi:arylsulfatase
MTNLPFPTPEFQGRIERLVQDSTPVRLEKPESPKKAPNVLLIMLDDVGFGSPATFGGPVPMPAVERIARDGLRFNQFHTTALCSPTRAALLTGRNHHSVHMGGITEIANSFPAYDSAIPPETASIAKILKENGYSTSCFGKWHLTPSWEQSPVGPFDRWPTGMGFDRFYGILGAEASQWEPAAIDQTTPIEPHIGQEHYHLSEDLADQAIKWIQLQKASAPASPFFCYFSPPAVHAPHHVPNEWIQKFSGMFDNGWDDLREDIFARQIELGVIPAETQLTSRPDEIPSWDSYPDRYKPVASRLMEVFAAFLAHTDAQVNRVLDAIDELGCSDDTLIIYITGDNGASAEGTINGAWSAPSFQNGVHEDPEWLLEHIDDFGTRRCENHFNVGWAWALDAPFKWMKQVASHFGGTRNAMVMSWPNGIAQTGELRNQFHHVIDIGPTILKAAGIEWPDQVNGIEQAAVEGIPMQYTFDDPNEPSRRLTQYFEILGNRAIYHEGWIASCFHGRLPWIRLQGLEFDGEQEVWELYNIENDFSQSIDLSEEEPEKLQHLKELFDKEARRNGVYPLRDAGLMRKGELGVPTSLGGRRKMRYTTAHVRMPESSVVNLKNTSHEVSAKVVIPSGGASGVIACQGGNMSGWTLYLDETGKVSYHYNCFGQYLTTLSAASPLDMGTHKILLKYEHDGGFGAGGEATLTVDTKIVDKARISRTVPLVYSISGETFDVGRDTGAPVGPYQDGFPFSGEIIEVILERIGKRDPRTNEKMEKGIYDAGLRTQ